ncbi:MAG TPA: alkaline phosphatase family protein [Flavisolibacter sp.]|nr:alkaline phosphatase family protein [Flavisolibacter sp.]
MRGLVICLVLITLSVSVSNTQKTVRPLNAQNKLFIITLDGFRWEEMFRGADSAIITDPESNTDTSIARALYWDENPQERRKKLLPFFWSVIARQGELYGNRDLENRVNVANPYALSYPGYSELLTGEVDYTIYGNKKTRNSNKNILQLLNKSDAYANKVAAFTSWDVFPYILGKKEKAGFMLNSGLEPLDEKQLTPSQSLLNSLQNAVDDKKAPTRYDELTYVACKEYILKNKPSVVFLSFSGTDNAAHEGRYDQYLQQANNADHMIGELWRLLQAMPEYAGKTTFLITTDHGRGKSRTNWSDHGIFVSGSSQTWYALLGNTVVPHGEMRSRSQRYQKELNSLVLDILSRK